MATIVLSLSSSANLNSKFKVLSLKGASSSSLTSSSSLSPSFSTRRGASAIVFSSLRFSQSVSQRNMCWVLEALDELKKGYMEDDVKNCNSDFYFVMGLPLI
ncbi:hypothetical protein Rs2_24826 [Raphanus sativus]|nr:hypothetical protein Rs2_24826 [Raphanus sativus]